VNKARVLKIAIFREEATSALAGFHPGPLSWSNWNLECWNLEGGKPEKPEKPEKNPRSKNKQQTQPTYETGPESINQSFTLQKRVY